MSNIKVRMTIANTGFDGYESFPAGTTLRQALKKMHLGADAVQVKVNRREVGLDDVLQDGDRVSVAPRNMKAA